MTTNVPNTEIVRLLQLADQNGIGEEFRLIYSEAIKHGLYPRTYKWSIMYAPQQNKTRVLVCVWVVPKKDRLVVYIASPAFAEFFPISERDVNKHIGRTGYKHLKSEEVTLFTNDLRKLFTKIKNNMA